MIYIKGGLNKSRIAVCSLNPRMRYTINEKVRFLGSVDTMVTAGVTQNHAASVVGVDPSCIVWWRGLSLGLLAESSGEKLVVPQPVNARFIDDIEPDLLGFIGGWRDRGLPVS